MNTPKKGRQLVKLTRFRSASHQNGEVNSVCVIGLGRFGQSLALELMANGAEVLGIDGHEEIVQSLNGELTQVVRADSTKEEALRQLAVEDFDRVVVGIGSDIQASILTCSVLVGMSIPMIWAKAVNDRHGLILEQLGVHHVVYPEKDMGRRVAHLVRGAAIDYVEIDRGYALVKASVPASLHGIRLGETYARKKLDVTIVAVRHPEQRWCNADADTVLGPQDEVLVIGPTGKAEEFAYLS